MLMQSRDTCNAHAANGCDVYLDIYSLTVFFHRKDGFANAYRVQTSAYSSNSSAHANAAAADKKKLAPVEAAGAFEPPGFELLMAPVEIIPAEQEF